MTLNDWERNLLSQRVKEEKLQREKRMLKGENIFALFNAVC